MAFTLAHRTITFYDYEGCSDTFDDEEGFRYVCESLRNMVCRRMAKGDLEAANKYAIILEEVEKSGSGDYFMWPSGVEKLEPQDMLEKCNWNWPIDECPQCQHFYPRRNLKFTNCPICGSPNVPMQDELAGAINSLMNLGRKYNLK